MIVIGKFLAVFITLPCPVLGDAMVLTYLTYFGVILSNLQVNIELLYKANTMECAHSIGKT